MKEGKLENFILVLLILLFAAFGYYLYSSIEPSKKLQNIVPVTTSAERQSIKSVIKKPFTLGNIEYTVLTVDNKGSKYGYETT